MFTLTRNSGSAACIALKQSLNSVIFFLLIQMTQPIATSHQMATRATSQQFNYLQPHRLSTPPPPPSPFRMSDEPLVYDTNSLYKSTKLPSRYKRSTANSDGSRPIVDACQSKMEVLTPYHATNSKGKLRTIINSELMQQAIQVETCLRSSTASAPNRCNAQADCGCEQKYKWHRLLVLDPSGETGPAKGLFMDWFLFPSNCVCRCKSGPTSTRHFMRTISQTNSKQ